MAYGIFEKALSAPRLLRYLNTVGGDKNRALMLYNLNLELSASTLKVISYFEISLRNSIDQGMAGIHGKDWLIDMAKPGGAFDNEGCKLTRNNICKARNELGKRYTHDKLIAELGFGFWRYIFGRKQYRALGNPNITIILPKALNQLDPNINIILFNKLERINEIRNRIAHHEPICFDKNANTINIIKTERAYFEIKELFKWMDIDPDVLLKEIDNFEPICRQINSI